MDNLYRVIIPVIYRTTKIERETFAFGGSYMDRVPCTCHLNIGDIIKVHGVNNSEKVVGIEYNKELIDIDINVFIACFKRLEKQYPKEMKEVTEDEETCTAEYLGLKI